MSLIMQSCITVRQALIKGHYRLEEVITGVWKYTRRPFSSVLKTFCIRLCWITLCGEIMFSQREFEKLQNTKCHACWMTASYLSAKQTRVDTWTSANSEQFLNLSAVMFKDIMAFTTIYWFLQGFGVRSISQAVSYCSYGNVGNPKFWWLNQIVPWPYTYLFSNWSARGVLLTDWLSQWRK